MPLASLPGLHRSLYGRASWSGTFNSSELKVEYYTLRIGLLHPNDLSLMDLFLNINVKHAIVCIYQLLKLSSLPVRSYIENSFKNVEVNYVETYQYENNRIVNALLVLSTVVHSYC
jgi:hypothetical protein